MKLLVFIFGIILFNIRICFGQDIYILIHGTWACKENWHQLEGQFYQSLAKSVEVLKSKLISFEWNGQLNHESRMQAGKDLVKLILQYTNDIYIVAHSHGANVGIIASQLLSKYNTKPKIKAFFALGCPVDTQLYMPNMDNIEYYYNFYSNSDIIQPLFGLYKRVFPKHNRIANIEMLIEDQAPGHCQTHSEIIAYWIPFIHNYFTNYKIGNFENFDFEKNGKICFYKNRAPFYQNDTSKKEIFSPIYEYTSDIGI